MFVSYDWYLGSNIVTPSGSLQDTFLYLLVSHSAPIVRAQDKGARTFWPARPPLVVLVRGRVARPGTLFTISFIVAGSIAGSLLSSLSWGDFFLGVFPCLGIHCKTLYVNRRDLVGP